LVIPVCMYYFGKISVISFVANVVVVPTMGILLYLSVIFYLFTFIFSYAALFISFIISAIMHVVLTLTVFFGSLSFASVDIAKPSVFQLFLFFAFVFSATLFKDKKRFICLGILIIINLLYIIIPACYRYGRMEVNIYDSKNMAAVCVKDKTGYHVTLYQKSKYYDKYFVNALNQFLKFKGIKNPDIKTAGFEDNYESKTKTTTDSGSSPE